MAKGRRGEGEDLKVGGRRDTAGPGASELWGWGKYFGWVGEPKTLSPERKMRAAVVGLGQYNPEAVADLSIGSVDLPCDKRISSWPVEHWGARALRRTFT